MKYHRLSGFDRLILLLCAVICFCAGFITCVAFYPPAEEIAARATQADYNISDQPNHENEISPEISVQPFTEIVKIRRYAKGDSVNITNEQATEDLYGLTRAELEALMPEWEIYSFGSDKLTLFKLIDSYGPDTYRLTSYTDENSAEIMAVFTYDEEGNEYLYKTVNTSMSLLSPEDAAKVRSGIFVKGKDKLEVLMQNYDE